MDWKALWQGILGNIVAAFLIFGGGAVLAFLSATHSVWAQPALYGIGGCSFIALLIFALTGKHIFSRQEPQTTIENVESNLRQWVDYFGLGVKKMDESDSIFAYLVTCRSGISVIVARVKARERYLVFAVNMEISQEHRDFLSSLSKDQSGRVAEELTLELARLGVSYNVSFEPNGTMNKVSLQRSIPITHNVTQDTFASYLDQMDSNTQVAREAIRLSIDNVKRLGK
jgi:hypothetical protein